MANLSLVNVSHSYGVGHSICNALTAVSVEFCPGEVSVILGPSGSGKSTLLSIAGLMVPPHAGTVVFDGKDVSALDGAGRAALRRRHFGFVFQSFRLIPELSVYENVAVALDLNGAQEKSPSNRVQELLAHLGLAGKDRDRPNQLSGGERQRVAIARSVIHNPEVVLADEPTAALDSENGTAVGKLLRALAKEERRSVVVVTHDSRLLPFSDRRYELRDGVLTICD